MESLLLDPVVAAAIVVVLTTVAIFVVSVLRKGEKSASKSASASTAQPKAKVAALNIYPIKSCAEIAVSKATVTARGFQYDRTFQVVSKVDNMWRYCTPRDKKYEKLFHVQTALSDDGKRLALGSPYTKDGISVPLDAPSENSLVTTVMGDKRTLLDDCGDAVSRWLSEATGIDHPRLVGINPDYFFRQMEVDPDQGEELPTPSPIPVSLADQAPFLLTARESIVDLNQRLMTAEKDMVDMRRFRPNVVIEGLEAWEEDSLKRVRIGQVEFHVWQRCGRCTMTTIDRDSLRRCGEPLSTLSRFRERAHGMRNFGMHLIPILEGEGSDQKVISIGDEVEILEYDKDRRAEWQRLFGKK